MDHSKETGVDKKENNELQALQHSTDPYGKMAAQPDGYTMFENPPAYAITNQPAAGVSTQFTTVPQQNLINCRPGLEYLAAIDQLIVHQKVELLEVFTGFETKNKYTIKNSLGQNVYWAAEESDCCSRICCGMNRAFEMKIIDFQKNVLINLSRPLICCCPCLGQSIEISSPPGNVIGRVVQESWAFCPAKFGLQNANGETVLRIVSPCCVIKCCNDIVFDLITPGPDGTKVGEITKQWSGIGREMFTDADHFSISFPIDLDVDMKAVCLGALFLIDFMFFENSNSGGAGGGALQLLQSCF